jgi:hypothetical protein
MHMIKRALTWTVDTVAVAVGVALLWLVGQVFGMDASDELDPEQVDQ